MPKFGKIYFLYTTVTLSANWWCFDVSWKNVPAILNYRALFLNLRRVTSQYTGIVYHALTRKLKHFFQSSFLFLEWNWVCFKIRLLYASRWLLEQRYKSKLAKAISVEKSCSSSPKVTRFLTAELILSLFCLYFLFWYFSGFKIDWRTLCR